MLKRPVSDSDSNSVSHSVCCPGSLSLPLAPLASCLALKLWPHCAVASSHASVCPPFLHTRRPCPCPCPCPSPCRHASLVSSCTRHFVLVKTRQGISHGWAIRKVAGSCEVGRWWWTVRKEGRILARRPVSGAIVICLQRGSGAKGGEVTASSFSFIDKFSVFALPTIRWQQLESRRPTLREIAHRIQLI